MMQIRKHTLCIIGIIGILVLMVIALESSPVAEVKITPTPLPPIRSSGIEVEPTITPCPTVVDTGLAYEIPCRPPCWQGVTPGETTRQEAGLVVTELQTSGQICYADVGPEAIGIYFPPCPDDGPFVVWYFEEDILEEVSGGLGFHYTLETLIEQFGPPEKLFIKNLFGITKPCTYSCDEWQPSESPVMSVGIDLLYPSQGLDFGIAVPAGIWGCICPAMPIRSFQYFAPVSMQEWTDNYQRYLRIEIIPEEHLVDWHGYGGGY